MRTNASITIEWTGGFRNKPASARARDSVMRSVDMAAEGFATIGVELTGSKTLIVFERDDTEITGRAPSTNVMGLYTRALEREREEDVIEDASTIIHEGCHNERMKSFPFIGRLEQAIGEGLSYNGEFILGEADRLFREADDRVRSVRELSPELLEKMGGVFMSILNGGRAFRDGGAAWLDRTYTANISRAEVLGVRMVDAALSQGLEFCDGLLLPAEEFIPIHETAA